MEKIKSVFGKVFDFKNKTVSRRDFLIVLAAAVVVALIAEVINVYVAMVVELLLLIPLLAAGYQRYRDTGYPGWWCLMLVLVTLSGAALGTICLAMTQATGKPSYTVLAVILYAVAAVALIANVIILAKKSNKAADKVEKAG